MGIEAVDGACHVYDIVAADLLSQSLLSCWLDVGWTLDPPTTLWAANGMCYVCPSSTSPPSDVTPGVWWGVVGCGACRAPDGTCLLVASADCKMRLYNLPSELYSGPTDHQLPEMVM